MKHLDLFSGIGGFALAVEMAFPDEKIEHVFCDNDAFAQAILKKHWPNSTIHDDIKTLTKKETGGGIYLLTGGFPCQPFSAAGRRTGTQDDRHLWPEMLRVIRETNPEFVLGENVGGLLTWDGGLVLEMVLADLESADYEAGAFVIPAAALNAPHRRDRVWIAAHAIGSDAGGASGLVRCAEEGERIPERNEMGKSGEPSGIRHVKNSEYESTRNKKRGGANKRTSVGTSGPDTNDANSQHAGLERREHEEAEGHGGQPNRSGSDQRRQWREDWPEVAARLCIVDDGLPYRMARPTGWRNAALKGAGNAIVPQIAAEILRSMIILNKI